MRRAFLALIAVLVAFAYPVVYQPLTGVVQRASATPTLSAAKKTAVPDGDFTAPPGGDVGTPPANHDFETSGLSGWTTTGTVQALTGGPTGTYASIAVGGTLTSAAFTPPADAQVLSFDTRLQPATGSDYVYFNVTILHGSGYATEDDGFVVESPGGTTWGKTSVSIDAFHGGSIKLKITAAGSAGTVQVDNVGEMHQGIPHWHRDDGEMIAPLSGEQHGLFGVIHAWCDDFHLTFTSSTPPKKVARFRIVYQFSYIPGSQVAREMLETYAPTLSVYLGDHNDNHLYFSATGSNDPTGSEEYLNSVHEHEFDVWNPDDANGGTPIDSYFDILGTGQGVDIISLMRIDDPGLDRTKDVSIFTTDPVDVVTGNYSMTHTDLSLPGLGGGLAFTRTYSSMGADQTPPAATGNLGARWSHNWQSKLSSFSGGDAVAVLVPGGAAYNFSLVSGAYQPQGGLDAVLVHQFDGSWLMTLKDQRAFHFDDAGRLVDLSDRNGNTTTLAYDVDTGLLTTITDEGGRSLRFGYGNLDDWRLITSVSDSSGRTVRYGYANGDLTTISDVMHGPIGGTVVEPTHLNGWAFAQEGASGTGSFVSGPGAPPSGTGSARLTSTATTGSEVIATTALSGTYLGEMSALHYSTFVSSSSSTTVQAPTLQFDMDYDLTDGDTSAQGWLVFEPKTVGTVTKGEWQTWSPMDGSWWATGSPGITNCPQAAPCTWWDVQGYWPNAGVRASTGAVRFASGTGWPAFEGNIDAFTVTTSTGEHDYDFEPGPYVGDTVAYEYSPGHLLTQGTDAKGHVFVRNTYDSYGRVTQQLDAASGTTTIAYDTPGAGATRVTDQRGKQTTYYFDQQMRITDVVDHDAGTTSYVYDSKSNRTSVTNPLGKTWTYTYDSRGNILTATDPLSETTTYTYNSKNDVLTVTDPQTRVTTYAYDTPGNLTSVTDASSKVTTFTIGTHGLVSAVTDPLSHSTSFGYNGFGDRTTVTNSLSKTWTTAYDSAGRATSVTDPLSHATSYTYNNGNNLLTVTDPLSHLTTYTYDANGNVLTVTDANSKVTTYGYDGKDQLSTITDPGSGVTTFGYDAVGHITSKQDPRGKTTTYAYDNLGRLHTETDPLSYIRTYNYDAASRLSSRTDPKSQTISYTYSDRNELTNITYPNSSFVSFAYSNAGSRTQMVDPTGTTTYAYDNLYRLTGVTFPGSRTVSYGYDDASRQTSITYPGGSSQVAYAYDAANRLSTVTDWNSNQTVYAYDDANRMTSTTLPNGVVSTPSYDNANRLTGISHVKGGTTLASVSYTVDAVGNRTDRTDQAGTQSYSYDNLYRLTSVTYPGPTTTTYSYDAFGNRTQKVDAGNTTSYAYDDASRLTTVTPPSPASPISYTWDNNGNLTNRGSDTFSWDYEDRMTSATVGATTWTYAYRGDGLRDSATTGGVSKYFTWDINGGLPVILDDGSQYIYGNGLISQVSGANTYYYLADGLGSTMKTTDASGAVVNAYTYDVYGKTTASSGSQANDIQFAGQQTDPTGLQYLRARYYDPETGGFLSRDRMMSSPSWLGSPTAYANGRPTQLVDPSGLGACYGPDGDCEGGVKQPKNPSDRELKHKAFIDNVCEAARDGDDSLTDFCNELVRGLPQWHPIQLTAEYAQQISDWAGDFIDAVSGAQAKAQYRYDPDTGEFHDTLEKAGLRITISCINNFHCTLIVATGAVTLATMGFDIPSLASAGVTVVVGEIVETIRRSIQ